MRNDDPVATIQFKKKIAQRKFSDSVVWERLQQNSYLYNEDIIRTDMDSAASILFDNVTVDLDEKTMIQIFAGKDGQLKLAVSGGNFSVDTSEATTAVKIDLGNGSVINLEKGSRLSASNDNGKSSIVISEGTGSITTEEGEEEFILAGDSVKIDETGTRVKIPVTVKNMDAVQKILVFEGQNKNIDFEFNVDSSVKEKAITFETSFDSDFASIDQKKVISSEDKIFIEAKKGTFFYRVYPESNAEQAYAGKVIVDEIKKPRIISPNVNFTYESINVMPDVLFVWDAGLYCDYCRLEVYDENDVNNPVISQDVADSSVKISSLNEGKYFWKIIPHYSVNDIGFKDDVEFRKFAIVRQQLNLSPELSVPAMGSNIVLSAEAKDILFACKSDIKNSSYRFEVSKDKDFNKDIVYSSTEDSVRRSVSLTIGDLPKGQYFWRVVRIDDRKGEYYSTVRDFTVSEFVPKTTRLVFPPENFSAESGRIALTQFIWNLSDSVDKTNTKCIFEIAGDAAFTKDVQKINAAGLSYTGLKLNAGKYFWRVRAVDAGDNSEIAKTDARVLNVLNELEVPEILTPKNNSKLTVYPNDSVRLSWNQVSDADYYNVKIMDSKTGAAVSELNNIKKNSVNVLLDANVKYKFEVIACTEDRVDKPARSSKTSQSAFELALANKLRLVSPADNAVIEGLSALRKPVRFVWTEDGSDKNKEFVLTRIYPNGTTKVVSSVSDPEGSVTVSRLPAGSYRWTVNATDKNGVSVSPDVSFRFTVTQIPPLDPVIVISPADKFVIDIPYLKNNRAVSFKWKAVPNATDYMFELYQKNDNGTLRKIESKNIKSTTFELTDLTVLDVGKFEWQVTAFAHTSGGYQEQKSPITVTEFSVNLDLPDTVKTKDPGRMYAE